MFRIIQWIRHLFYQSLVSAYHWFLELIYISIHTLLSVQIKCQLHISVWIWFISTNIVQTRWLRHSWWAQNKFFFLLRLVFIVIDLTFRYLFLSFACTEYWWHWTMINELSFEPTNFHFWNHFSSFFFSRIHFFWRCSFSFFIAFMFFWRISFAILRSN